MTVEHLCRCVYVAGGEEPQFWTNLIGTQVQSADAGGDESVNQTATPSNTPGIVGDKPIETIGEVGKAALTSGASTVLKQAATGTACADGACAVPACK